MQAPNLQHIDLHHNNLNGTAETIAQLISVSYYLQYINLANTLMQDEEVMIIVKAMQNINSLCHVDLTSYTINDKLALELQSTIDRNAAVIYFQFSRLCLKKIEVTIMTLGKNIFSIVINLREISISFGDCENDQVDAAASLINKSLDLQYLQLESCSVLEIYISNIIIALARTTTLEYFSLINVVFTDKVDDGIAAVLENNTQLKHFKLVACKLTEKGLAKCIQLFNTTRLSHLVLSKMDNLISHTTRQLKRPICDSLTHLNLSNVHLNVTKLSFLSLPSLTKLQHLNLNHNPLTDESASILSSVICNNHGLKHLDLCDCKLQSEGIRVIANSLQAINVVYLDMSLNTINIDTFNNNVIPVLFSSLSIVECLYLPYCKLKVKEIGKILDFISNAMHLKFIDFGPNTIPKDMISDFKNIIFVSKANKQICFSIEGLKKVNFNNYETENLYHSFHYLNINNVIVNGEVATTVAALIAKSPELEHLEMAGSEWNCTMTEVFCLLRGCTALKVLELHNCCRLKDTISMTTKDPAFLHLNYLDLSNNYIDDKTVNYLTVLIATNVGLEHLNFRACKLSFFGIQNISSALKVTSSLKFLDIKFSDIEGKSLIEDQVATLLANNKHLEQLRLSSLVLNNIIFHQIQPRLLAIKELQQLTINECIFTDKDISTIISLVANNSTLHELTLLNCEMSMKSKIKFICIATALYMQCLKFDSITVTDIKHSPNTSLQCKFNLTDDDVVAVMIVNNYLGEFIMFKLILNQNSLKVLCTNTVTIRYLKFLHIQDCTFTDHDAHYMASLITNNATTIQSFSLTSCKMSMIQRMIITKALCKLNIILLQHLNIEDILYSNEEYEANICLYSCFTITNCKLTDEIITAVMVSNKSLRISKLLINQSTLLELRKTLFVDQGNKKISLNADHIKTSKLERVNLNNHDTGHLFHSLHYLNVNNVIVNDEVVNTVANVIANSPELERLKMAGGGWTFTSAMKCFRTFQTTKKLIYLNLSKNSFTLTELLSLLSNFIALKFLHLCECGLKSTGIIPLTTLNTVTTLNWLNLSSNSIDDEAVNYLAVLIATNVGLEYLSFYNCMFSSSGIQIISNALKMLSSLKFLDIRCNITDGKGLHYDVLVTMLANSKHLEQLNLFNLVLDNNKFRQIKSHLLVIKGLEQLMIKDCTFTDEDTSTIISLIANNPTLHKLCLLDCELSVKSKMNFSCMAAAALEKELGTITVTSPINKKNKYLPHINTSIYCNVSLTDDDVLAVMTVDNDLKELIMFKLILKENSLKVLSANSVMVRGLTLLQIQHCTFTDNYAYYVATLITNNIETIKCFSLTVCQMSIKQKMIITKALYELDIILLQHLNIRDNIYTDDVETTASLKYFFTKANCKLTDNIITAVMTDHNDIIISKLVINQNTLAALKSNLRITKGVIHLTINDCKFDVETDKNVANVITNNDCIQEFILSNCVFPQKHSETFKSLSFLQSLNVICFDKIRYPKNFEDEIIPIITNNPGLSYFTMSRFHLNNSSLVKIMHGIAESLNNLIHINFSDLKCSSEVVQYITTVITHNTTLKHINLCNCQLLTVGVKNIIQAAKGLTTLEYFNLSYNQLTGDLLNDVTTLIAFNMNIKVLSLPNYTLVVNHNSRIKVVLTTVTNLLVNGIATLITNKDVTELNLLNCTLNSDQFKVVFNAVKKSSLPLVHFTINEISNTDLKDVIENKSRIKEFKKVFKLLAIQDDNMIMHHSCDLVKYTEIDHLSIVGCTFDFKEWNVLKQLVVHSATLKTLILSDCQLYSEISEIISICTHLSYLGLTNVNTVTSQIGLSDNITIFKSELNNLNTISISSVNFTEQMMVDILNILYNSKNLDHFAMVKCKINGCEDSGLWTAFFACKNLLHLDLSYSNISGEIVDCILTHSNNLTHIKLVSCNFDKKDVFQICNRLHALYNIVYLNLSSNKNICYYASEIAAVITFNNNLRHIELAACNFDVNGIIRICRSIRSCTRLQNINLSHNEIASNIIGAVVPILHRLEYINLRKCGLTSRSSKIIIMELASIDSLKSVDLSLNEITEDSAVDITAMIANNSNIEVLCLPNCIHTSASSINERNFLLPCYSLSRYMAGGIFDAIKRSRSLKCVEFGVCQLNNDLASEVAALTASNRGLVQLRFPELVLTHNGLKQLGNSILIIEGLNNISITNVHFTDSDADNLATLINNNKSLKSLDISDCVISDEGKNIIFEAMINLTSLKSLNLKNIVISDIVLNVIANNTNLEYLEVTGCEMNAAKLNKVISSFNNLKVVF